MAPGNNAPAEIGWAPMPVMALIRSKTWPKKKKNLSRQCLWVFCL